MPWSLMPNAAAEVPPLGMNWNSELLLPSEKACPLLPPTITPVELIALAMAVVELSMVTAVAGRAGGVAVKLLKLTLSAVVNPTTVPVLEMPSIVVPKPTAPGPLKLVK